MEEQSQESITRVIEGIKGVLKEVYPGNDPDDFVTEIDDDVGVTQILIHIIFDMTEWKAWGREISAPLER